MATIILPTTTADIIDGAVTEEKLSDTINISKFINDEGYISSLGAFTTDDVTEGTLNLYYTDDRVVTVIDDYNLNQIKLVNTPVYPAANDVSFMSLNYTGTYDGDASGSIQLYNATTATTNTNISFDGWSTTINNFLTLNWIVRLGQIDTATLNALGFQGEGSTAYCSDGDAGSPCLAVFDGTNWRRISFGAAISTT